MDYGPIIAVVVAAVMFYGAATRERAPAVVWAALSVLASVLAIAFTPWRVWGVLGAQVVLFIGIALFRLWREGDANPD